MHITLISVGKLKTGPEKELVDDYVARFNKAGPGIGLRSLKLVDLASGGGLEAEVPHGTYRQSIKASLRFLLHINAYQHRKM